jgi:hypothetical protein
MDHKQYKEWLVLSLYGELSKADNELLKSHLEICDECSKEFAELKKLQTILNEGKNKFAQPSDELLSEARLELRAALRIEKSRISFFSRMAESVKNFLMINYKPVLSGAVALLIGIALGYIFFNKGLILNPGISTQIAADEDPFEKTNIKIDNLRIINQDENSGEISFAFEAVKPVQIKGNIKDKYIQKVLAHSLLNEKNDGVRLRTVNAIAAQKNEKLLLDPKIKTALITAMKNDNNPGVRREALLVLQNYKLDEDVNAALLYVLQYDTNPGLRVAAINSLTSGKISAETNIDENLLNVLKEKSKTDDNNYIRYRAASVLQEVVQQ